MIRVSRVLVLLGPLFVVFSLSKYHAAQVANPPYDFTASFRLPWAIGLVVVYWLCGYAAGLPSQRPTRRSAWLSAATVSVAATSVLSLAQLAVGSALLPRFVVFASGLIMVPFNVLATRIGADGNERDRRGTPVVVVGGTDEIASLRADLAFGAERAASIVATLSPMQAEATETARPLIDLAVKCDATVVVLGAAAQSRASVVRQAAILHREGMRIRTLSAFSGEWLGKLPTGDLERTSLMFDIAELHGSWFARVKRLTDVAVGVAGLGLLLVLTPAVIVGNLLGNRGPLFFRQTRVGKSGCEFSMWKFRTMRDDPAAGTSWTGANDSRVTPFGRWMRRTHLDELPQCWNILRGDLSLVGPRPEQPHYVEELEAKLPYYGMRHLVRPGLTGWAQVKYGYASNERDALEKLQYEFYYLRHQSMRLDWLIVVRTVRAVVGGPGAGR